MNYKYVHIVLCFIPFISYVLGILSTFVCIKLCIILLLFFLWLLVIDEKIKNSRKKWQYRWIQGVCISLFWMFLGIISMKYAKNNTKMPLEYNELQERTFVFYGNLKEKKQSFQFDVKLKKDKNKLLIYTQCDNDILKLAPGDIFTAKCKIENLNNLVLGDFNYGLYLKRHGYKGTIYLSKDSWKKKNGISIDNIVFSALKIRNNLYNRYKEIGLDDDVLGLVSAMSLGKKSSLSQDVKENFSQIGVSHLLALSGLHVAAIYGFLNLILFFMSHNKLLRILRTVIIVLVLIFYCIMTGFLVSVMRTSLMFILFALGGIIRKRTKSINIVIITAFILLIINPFFIYDAGYLLSFSAVSGIVILYPKLNDLCKSNNKIIKYVWSLVCISIIAQISTLPFILYFFKAFPNYFLFSNIILVPFAGLIIYLSLGLLLCSCVGLNFHFGGMALSFVTNLFLKISRSLSSLPFSQLNVQSFKFILSVLLVCIIIYLISFFLFKRRKSLLYSLEFMFVFELLKFYYCVF